MFELSKWRLSPRNTHQCFPAALLRQAPWERHTCCTWIWHNTHGDSAISKSVKPENQNRKTRPLIKHLFPYLTSGFIHSLFSINLSQFHITSARLANHLQACFHTLPLTASLSIPSFALHDCVPLWIWGHTLHYSSYIQVGGEIPFCLSGLCDLKPEENSPQIWALSALVLATLAHQQ